MAKTQHMKRLLFAACLIACTVFASSQECKGYYYLHNGSIEMTFYDNKQKENGKLQATVSGAATSGGVTSATINSEMFNEKGKSLSKSTGTYQCKGGVMYVDARISMPSNVTLNEANVTAENNFIEYPSAMTEGMALKDVHFTLDMAKSGTSVSSVVYDQIDRKITGKESVTTPAGTWEWNATGSTSLQPCARKSGESVSLLNSRVPNGLLPGSG